MGSSSRGKPKKLIQKRTNLKPKESGIWLKLHTYLDILQGFFRIVEYGHPGTI